MREGHKKAFLLFWGFFYSCVTAISAPAADIGELPQITQQPQDLVVEYGCGEAEFQVVASSSSPMTYEWLRNGEELDTWFDPADEFRIVGVRSEKLRFIAPRYSDEAEYSCSITNLAGSVTSVHANLWVGGMTPVDTPRGGTYYAGTPLVTLAVDGFCNFYPNTYQWYKDDVAVTPTPVPVPQGADISVYLSLHDIDFEDSGEYVCKVKNSHYTWTSPIITIRVVGHLENPRIVQETLKVGEGQRATLEAKADGGIAPFSYQWFKKDGANTWVPLGVIEANLVLEPVTLADAGLYHCKIADQCGLSRCTNEAHIIVNTAEGAEEGEIEGEGGTPLTIIEEPQDLRIYTGMQAAFRITAAGGYGPLTYNWRNDENISVGSASIPRLVLPSVTREDIYYCLISDGFSSVLTRGAELHVYSRASTGQHTADQDLDWSINLSEMLRVIQLYNSNGFHCETGTEDGYAPGSGDVSGSSHNADYNPADWKIDLSELLRFIQLYDSGAYHCKRGTEDGFGLGAGPEC